MPDYNIFDPEMNLKAGSWDIYMQSEENIFTMKLVLNTDVLLKYLPLPNNKILKIIRIEE